mmetsp:Transcript_16263/g.46285  ORF Transcript_16263/g.46285 Transcript_16263/m.46285 type:complete len:203 (-) Transcript_16263:413-1021(-)
MPATLPLLTLRLSRPCLSTQETFPSSPLPPSNTNPAHSASLWQCCQHPSGVGGSIDSIVRSSLDGYSTSRSYSTHTEQTGSNGSVGAFWNTRAERMSQYASRSAVPFLRTWSSHLPSPGQAHSNAAFPPLLSPHSPVLSTTCICLKLSHPGHVSVCRDTRPCGRFHASGVGVGWSLSRSWGASDERKNQYLMCRSESSSTTK